MGAFPVIARNFSFQYRGGNLDLKSVSEALGVRYIVEGSVRRADDRIRVTARLIDATSGEHVGASTYDREIAHVFDLQDEISAMIAAPPVHDFSRAEARRAQPDLSLDTVQGMYGVTRPEIDDQRNAVLRQAGLK
jgi:hypothetical protein